jgi:predicted ATP-dependent endonuclease of OLD family
MYKIDNIEIHGFWGLHKVETNFHQDINIFIGRNGTGKTTFINLLQAFLSVDLELLYSLQFEKIIVNLKDKAKKRKIELSKISEELEYKRIEYKIGTAKFNLPFLPDCKTERPNSD